MTSRSGPTPARIAHLGVTLATPLLLIACASSSITNTGALSSYDWMAPVKTTRAKAQIRADETALAAARTVRIAPVVFTPGAGVAGSPGQDALIANAIGRTLCARLNTRFDIVPADTPADMTVKVSITRMTPTDAGVVGATLALRVAGTVVGVPFPVRVPLGLGSFSAEGEAVSASGVQDAAMTWARGADMFTTSGRVSKIGDAYEISRAFAGDMATLLTTGKNPLREFPSLKPGGKKRPLSPVCLETYGKDHGTETRVAGFVGAPPAWTDKSAPDAPPR